MIIYFIKIILFLLSFYGLTIFIKEKLKIEKEFSYAITVIILVLILFLSAILNILKICTIILHLFGFIYLIYNIIKNKKKLFNLDYKMIIIILFILYLTLLGSTMTFTAYDDFSHWALIVKQLFTYDALPSFEYNVVDFTTYPPASALFIYYFGSFVGRTETSMIIGQLYFTFVFLTPLMIFIKKDNKIFNSIIFILFSLFIINCNTPLVDLFVDTVLGTMGIVSCTIAYFYRKNLKKAFILLTIISCGFVILKNVGLLFVAFDILLLLILGFYNKKAKKSLKYIVFLLVVVFSVFLLWQQHLKMVYPGNTGVTTKHSISLVNFKRTVSKNGIGNSKAVAVKYYTNIKKIKTDSVLHYLIGINALLVLSMILSKKYKEHLKIILLIDVLYFCYWFCLGILYIISMPYDEAIRLACYGRYMMSSIIVLFGITFITIAELDLKNIKYNKIYNVSLIVLVIGLKYFNSTNSYKDLFNFDGTSHKELDKVKKIVKDYPLDKYADKKKIVYFDCDFPTFYYYMLKYEYFSKDFDIACNLLDTSNIENGSIIFTPEGIMDLSNDKNVFKIKDNVYEVKK